ncbi:MAG: 3-deoxy-manno-octulosonate cytidylyltransferase [Candidatus Tectomicrobia bacterium]|uniref:3-deoxy-manno-octulosonate cytidylyltransferase n=1 Tax=Tectimicrobiota bacterium TaxID=2528274 RepID=A0A933GLP1_UNCTE|nr:3-deoxy-manno-octulosonate cytidylyltransferase [Candidatus Tectomicrobia bacterium]
MKQATKVIAVIPARYASTRFPGKPLALILGKPMLQYVYERSNQAALVDKVVIATDDERITSAAESFGAEVVMTSPDCATGTDRIAEVSKRNKYKGFGLVVNVQGDEPLIDPKMIDSCVEVMLKNSKWAMATSKCSLENLKELFDPNVVKVVTDKTERALYFSRSPIPYDRDRWGNIFSDKEPFRSGLDFYHVFRHIGIYVYRRHFLLKFTELAPTPLEKTERLEQLRALEHGFTIGVVKTKSKSVGVDTPEDLALVEEILKG